MKNQNYKIKIILGASVVFFTMTCVAQAISISPQMIEFRSSPGEIKEFKIKLKNDEKTEICFKLEVEAIRKMSADGSPVFDTITASRIIAPWFAVKEKNVCAKPGEIINPTLVIQIPQNTRPAGYYAAAYFTSVSNGLGDAGSAIINRVGVLVAVRVDGGAILEQGKISQFAYDRISKKFLIDFINDGTIHLRPYGEIVIKNNAGQIIATLPFNEGGVLVLPASNRHFEILWDKRLYENSLATLQVLYGTGPKMASATTELKAQVLENEINSRLGVIGLLIIGALALGFIVKKIRRNYV